MTDYEQNLAILQDVRSQTVTFGAETLKGAKVVGEDGQGSYKGVRIVATNQVDLTH